jgi:hypothetical protein
LICYKDINNKIIELSKLLKNKSENNIKEYCYDLYQYLKDLKYEDIENVYQIDFSFKKNVYHKKGFDVIFWILEIKNFTKISNDEFTEQHYEAQRVFLNKIKFDEKMNYSLERYHQRHSDQESQNMSGKNTITNPNQ